MRTIRLRTYLPFVLAFTSVLGQSLSKSIFANDTKPADILTTAARNGNFRTLVSAVVAAGLDGALKGEGHFTVFAPTDAAFAKLPQGTLEKLLKPENLSTLTDILKYHVVADTLTVADKATSHRIQDAKTLLDQKLRFSRKADKVFVNESEIVIRNIECSNGVIQVIDAVLLPKTEAAPKTIASTVIELSQKPSDVGEFTLLLAALKQAELVEVLSGKGNFTVFAPTDAAFKKLPKKTLESLLQPENRSALQAILKYHVLGQKFTAKELVGAEAIKTLQGAEVQVSLQGGRLTINNSTVVVIDIQTSNGIIHVIDTVLLPKGK